MKTEENQDLFPVPGGENTPERHKNDGGLKEYRFKEIIIDEISTEGQMVRSAQDDDHVIELASSISRHGLLEPILVRDKGTHYQLLAGFHRVMACKRLGWKYIPAQIRYSDTDAPTKSLALVENIIRRDMSLAEECAAVAGLYENEKLSVSQICDLLGRGRAWVENRLYSRSMPEFVKTALYDGLIPMNIALKICEVDDEGIRNQVTNQAAFQKWNYNQVCQVVELYKNTPTMGEAVEAGQKTFQELLEKKEPERTCQACGKMRPYHQLQVVWICAQTVVCAPTPGQEQ